MLCTPIAFLFYLRTLISHAELPSMCPTCARCALSALPWKDREVGRYCLLDPLVSLDLPHTPLARGTWSPSVQSTHQPSVGSRTLRFLWFPKVPRAAAHPHGQSHKCGGIPVSNKFTQSQRMTKGKLEQELCHWMQRCQQNLN